MSNEAPEQPSNPEPDWKSIAITLARRCRWVIENIHSRDSTTTINLKTNEIRHWKDSLMDAVELIPGLKFDRPAVYAISYPRKERDAWFKKHRPENDQENQ